MTGRPVDQTHNHFLGNIISPPTDRLSLPGIQTISRVGPFPIAFDTPDLVNPPVDNGPVLFTVQEGSLFLIIPIVRENFDQPGQINFFIAESGQLNSTSQGRYDITAGQLPSPGIAAFQASPFTDTLLHSLNIANWILTDGNVDVGAALYPDADDPTTGAWDIYALIATPAAA